MSYTHLHLHTEYSMLDGANKIKNLIQRLKELGMSSVSMTDHGNMFGAIEFYKSMKAEGIKPIIGMEAYVHNYEELNSKEGKQRFHLCLYAKNEVGYKNLMFLSSMAFIEGFYYYPRISKKLLREHSEGLVASSACLGGEVNFHLNTSERNKKRGAKGIEMAKEVALEYRDIFGEDFYLEIMRHGINHQENIDDLIIRISQETGIKLIATNDAHYISQKDHKMQEVVQTLGQGKTLNDPNRLKHTVFEFYVKSSEEMERIFADIPEALRNTQEIVEKCNLEIELKDEKTNPPTPPTFIFTKEYAKLEGQEIDNDADFFAYKSRQGLEEYLKIIPQEKHQIYRDRLEEEIRIITQMKFPGYMLIVWDFIHFAKSQNIPVGPGRGSAAGSLVAFCLKITDIDPMKYNLLFERFLNPERVSMPDIDTDFCQRRRGEVIEYMIQKYGKYNVAQVITFGKLLAKNAIRDVARVLDMPLKDADAFAKLIPNQLGIKLEDAHALEPKIEEFMNQNPKARDVWEYALQLEGLNRNAGKHAAAIVLDSEKELWHKTPLCTVGKSDDSLVTQYSMKYLEPVDLIKFDFLGLKTLTVVHDALELIKKRYGKEIDFLSVDVDDKKVYETIQSGDTLGIFQIESSMFQGLNKRIKPSNFEDIIAIIALGRPGPMESGMVDDFINRKHGLEEITYMFDALEPILKPTYGTIVYQEQVMQIVQTIGGFSLGGADLVRRAMGKKIKEEMERLKSDFATGAEKNGFDRAKAEDLWELIVKFAGYGFNKSHSAAYAMITFQTAYLKTYYKEEFMAALLSSESGKIESVAKYINEVKKMDMDFMSPHVNISEKNFGVANFEHEGMGIKKIIFGLSAIKGVGDEPIQNIISVREKGGDFKSLEDFISRVDFSKITKRVLEPLIKSGGLDGLGYSRACMLKNLDAICEAGRRKDKAKESMAQGLFGGLEDEVEQNVRFDFSNFEEFPLRDLLDLEFECLGIYVSGHPLEEYRESIEGLQGFVPSVSLGEVEEDSYCLIAGKVSEITRKMSKSNKPYGYVNLLDLYGKIEIMFFEKQLLELEKFDLEQPIVLKCKIERDDEGYQVRIIKILTLKEAQEEKIDVGYKKDSALLEGEMDSCCPLVLHLDHNAPKDIFDSLAQSIERNKGNRELRIIIKDKYETYMFITEKKVDSAITQECADLEWSSWK
ncbi:DNA polymerase III subunit alpha [Helicobacter mustelae]|uniref:DNA polymerase III subunit alpha n=1 Tax=Helicobacter mustelae (strain ATCC 43772 / CCUG 25715 / CIP 103759 / LMG 18044 / NCTC 12198 / R85-136P) TaxID=679897 RepID=D3UFZ1_HELM1|nr:DNA polymerase III subunit alpha [Helicobacter mustelae]CBG39412.1 DNA polymerase III, alpha chain [Helicobacter mustelae 12198]SQH70925.1 DNA polymerase III subunit alpha [Helicobacter mustelae]STP12052.1 DNA polymerase III subunit alpha [Helicobacter mustelae]